ncbi:MAG: hypothetical protein ABIQ30_01720 [Devosia sp.]
MKKLLFVTLMALACVPHAAQAAGTPPTAAQKAEFYKVCVSVSKNVPLCTCKADAAMKLIDTEFMAVVISAMRGKDPGEKYYDEYNDYIAHSTQACGMGGA